MHSKQIVQTALMQRKNRCQLNIIIIKKNLLWLKAGVFYTGCWLKAFRYAVVSGLVILDQSGQGSSFNGLLRPHVLLWLSGRALR